MRAERAGITCKSQMRNLKLQVLLSPAQRFTTTKCLGHEPPRFYSGSKASALSTVCFDTLGRFGAHLGKKNWQLLLRNTEVCWEKQIWESCAGSKVKWEKTKGVKGPGHLPWFTPCVIVGKSLNFSTENSLVASVPQCFHICKSRCGWRPLCWYFKVETLRLLCSGKVETGRWVNSCKISKHHLVMTAF